MSSSRRVAGVIALAALAVFTAFSAAPSPAAAAEDGLDLVAATRYELLPDEGRIHVSIQASATALTPDTDTLRTAYTGITLLVHLEAANVFASAEGAAIPVTISPAEEFGAIFLDIDFGRGIVFGERYDFRVDYDLFDAADTAEGELRITRALAIFDVWAFGTEDTPGSSVEVILPPGYASTVTFGDELAEEQAADGGTVLRASDMPSPAAFFAYVVAEQAGAYVETDLTVAVGTAQARFEIESWEDDPEWMERMQTVLTDGLPALADAIGLPYPIAASLRVREGTFSRLGDYAGFFDPLRRLIMVRYDGDAFVGLHEAAHIWFNDTLIDGRWIKEAFASFYAEEAARRAGIDGEGLSLTPFLEAFAVPLNEWGEPGSDTTLVEDYAYAASNEVAREIADLAGIDGLQLVWRAMRDDEFAYQPPGAETPLRGEARSSESWQRLLDLLEERTGADYDPLWIEWIVTDEQATMLDEREEARARYRATLEAADDWDLPRSLHLLMGSWQFDDAVERLAAADAVLEQRELIEQRAGALDLAPPDELRQAFEGSSGMGAAAAEAREELATLDIIVHAREVLTDEPTTLETVGLIGSDPPARLSAAEAEFEDGDLDVAVHEAEAASVEWAAAEERGRERVIVVGASVLAADALLLSAALLARRRRSASLRKERPTDAQPTS